MDTAPPRSPLPDFILLYVLLYGAFGVASPFLPGFVEEKGIPPKLIGVLFGAGTAVRLISAPIAGRLADSTSALRLTFAGYAIATALAVMGYLLARSFAALLVVTLLHAVALAPTTNLADALALMRSRLAVRGFEYGWVRGAGSAAFIVGSIIAGWAIAGLGLGVIVWLQAALMLAVPLALMRVPAARDAGPAAAGPREGAIVLLGIPVFRKVMLLAALILGSHALHDTFSVIRWRAAGITPQTTSVLWSLAVAAEVVVFFLIGPRLLQSIGPRAAIAFAALAGAVRWLVAAMTTEVYALALIQPLHGITFALLHLACMHLLARSVPEHLAATAQALYGTVAIGAATALLTIVSGYLYAWIGAASFGVMSVMCLAALPVCWSLPSRNVATA